MKKDRNLPPGMYRKGNAYYLVKQNKWIPLGSSLPDALVAYGKERNPHQGSMPDVLDRFLLNCKTRKNPVADNTYRQYAIAVERLKKALREFSPRDLEPHHIATLLDHYSQTPNMANRMRTVLLGTMSLAARAGLCKSNPVREVDPFPENKRDRYVTDEEFWAVYECANPWTRATMKLAYLTGQRIQDVLSRRITDIEDDGIGFVQQKTGKKLIVRAPGLKEAIEEAKQSRDLRSFWLICGPRGGRYAYKSYYDSAKRAAKKAGVENFRPNDLRAKAGTDAEEQNIDPTKLLGHSSPAMTKRYLRNRKAKVVAGPVLDDSKKIVGK